MSGTRDDLRPLIVHITADFPDAMVSGKTAVIRRLVTAATAFEHRVYSLNRQSGHAGTVMLPSGPGVTAVAYKAPGKGLFLRTRLLEVARAIADDLERHDVPVALFHAHKLTIEGLVVEHLANVSGKPFIVSIQGDTDLKIIGIRRDLHRRYSDILSRAAGVATLAPSSGHAIAKAFAFPEHHIKVLPCLTDTDGMQPAPVIGKPRFISLFHLLSASRKNLDGLASAALIAAQTLPDLQIDVFGGGNPSDVFAAQDMIKAAGAGRHIRLCGPLERDGLVERLHAYAGLVLPTRRESYGLVHVEAIFAGLPILWSKDRGVDGLFAANDTGYRCDPDDVTDIARGLQYLHAEETVLKASIADQQAQGSFDHLRHKAIITAYETLVRQALGEKTARLEPA